jgi:glycosyltransferase involved in cell wall biosynthesis
MPAGKFSPKLWPLPQVWSQRVPAMPEALISVIVPVYNVAPYLEKCLESIVSQTYPHLEIILADDGSTDSSGEICDAYAQRDERICICRQENMGVAAARNSGLDLAGGDYIGFVDPDDWILPDMYEELLQLLKEYAADMAQCGVLLDGETAQSYNEPKLTEIAGHALLETAIRNNFPRTLWCNLYSAALWRGLRFAEGYCYEDEMVFPEITKRCRKFIKTEKKLYNYNRINTGIVRSAKTMMHLRSKEKLIEVYIDFFEKNLVCTELSAFYLCITIPAYRLLITMNDNISSKYARRHNEKMHKIFCKYFQAARAYSGYCNYQWGKSLYLWLYRCFPRISYVFINTYKYLFGRV